MLILHIWRTISLILGYQNNVFHTANNDFVSVSYSRLLGTVNAYADYNADRGMTVVQRHRERKSESHGSFAVCAAFSEAMRKTVRTWDVNGR